MQKVKFFINQLIDRPRNLLILFLFVNMIPTFGLIFTEPVNTMGQIVFLLFPLGLYMVIFTISRNIGLSQLLLFPLLFIHAFQIVVFYLFGEDIISADMFLNTVTTSIPEAREVLDSLLPSVFFVMLVYIPTTVFAYMAMKRKSYLSKKCRQLMFYPGLLLIAIAYLLSFEAENTDTNRFNYHEDVYPVNLFYNLDLAVDRWQMSENYYNTSAGFKFNAVKKDSAIDKREIYVLVLGETSRADNWSLYGYERETTPRLALDTNLVFYKDAITQSNTTHKSVPIIMSAASAQNYNLLYNQKSIIEAFNEVDFTTFFISNQASNRSFTDFFAKEADEHKYLRFFGNPVNEYDEILVDEMKHYIDSVQGNLFFVLHTYGSHYNYTERYPEEFSKYKPDQIIGINKRHITEMVNAYDNTILYTDYVLSKITEILTNADACSAMLYISDHGEDLLDDKREKFLHASPKPTYYQLKIPFLMWFSPIYQTTFPDKVQNALNNRNDPVASDLVFHTVLDIANIDTDYSYHHFSLVNDGFKVQERMYLDDHYNPILYYNAGLKKEDKEMIKKKNMKY